MKPDILETSHVSQLPKVIGKIVLPESSDCVCDVCKQKVHSTTLIGKKWVCDGCLEEGENAYWQEQAAAQQRYQDRLDANNSNLY